MLKCTQFIVQEKKNSNSVLMLLAFVVITFSVNQSLCTFIPDCSWCEHV